MRIKRQHHSDYSFHRHLSPDENLHVGLFLIFFALTGIQLSLIGGPKRGSYFMTSLSHSHCVMGGAEGGWDSNHGELLIHFLAFVQKHNAKTGTETNKENAKGRHVTDGAVRWRRADRWRYLRHDTSAAQLARGRCCQPRPQGLDCVSPLLCWILFCRPVLAEQNIRRAHKHRQNSETTKNRGVDGGGGGLETQTRRHEK